MIDTHCHPKQANYDRDRDAVIERCRKVLDAVMTSCAHPKDFELTIRAHDRYKSILNRLNQSHAYLRKSLKILTNSLMLQILNVLLGII